MKDGFRLRGEDMTRLETFTDAAFAFAVTLLVVGGGDSIPTNFAEMQAAMLQVPAFAASFANICFSGTATMSGRGASGWRPRVRSS